MLLLQRDTGKVIIMYRPEGFEDSIQNPFMYDGVKMARDDPRKALELELQHQAFRMGQEAGADAMLEALRKEGKLYTLCSEIYKHGKGV